MTIPIGLPLGALQRITIAAPSAGADWAYTIPANVWAKLLSAKCSLTASAVSGSRGPGFIVTDGTSTLGRQEFFNSNNSAYLQASQTAPIAYSVGHVANTTGTAVHAPSTGFTMYLPPVVLPPGYTIGSVTPGLLSGDQYSTIQLLFVEWSALPLLDGWTPAGKAR